MNIDLRFRINCLQSFMLINLKEKENIQILRFLFH